MADVEVVYLSSLNGVPNEWEASCVWIKEWCLANKASFYSVPGEDFFINEGIELAVSEGNSIVLVDSLS